MKFSKSQSVLEYLIISAVIIVAVVSASFVGWSRGSFRGHFDKAKEMILE